MKSIGGVSLALAAAVLASLLVCFLAGLLAEAALTRRLIESVESLILSKMPGYSLMKTVGENLVGVEGSDRRKTVLVHLHDSAQLGFVMDELPDGRLVVFVPDTHADAVRKAMGDAGAGKIGRYSHCSFSSKGTGRFTPLDGADPAIGKVGKPEEVDEQRIEVACERSQVTAIIEAIKKAHPYEEVAVDIYPMLVLEPGKD